MYLKTNQLNFSLKLLLDQSVVLVEYPGHEPQLFMPAILDNGIVLQNVIFDYDAPLPNQQKPKLRDRKATTPVKKTSAHSGVHSIRPKRSSPKPFCANRIGSSGPSMININSSSFQWVRTGGSASPDEHPMSLNGDNRVSYSSPAIAPAVTASHERQLSKQPLKSGQMHSKDNSQIIPYFDAVRKFYIDRNHKTERYLPPVRKQRTLGDLTQLPTHGMSNLNFKF